MKKGLSFILSLIMVISVISSVPITVSAASVDDLTFTLNDDGVSYSVTDCTSTASGELIIPETYNGLPVTGIGYKAFYECTSITSVSIPESVTTIGHWAFFSCSNLGTINIPNGVTNIDEYTFSDCKKLTSINIPDSVTSISGYAFRNCANLSYVKIGNSVKSISTYAFYYCSSLSSVVLGRAITSIGDDAFWYCTNLKYVFYAGSQEQWDKITFGYFNSDLTSAIIHYEATDHIVNDWTVITEANCYQAGVKKGNCYVCDELIELVNAPMHNYSTEWTVDVKPTCTEDGIKSRHCTVCDDKTNISVIEAKGHNYTDWIVISEPTCTEAGSKYKVCSICGDVISETISANGHKFSAWITDSEPTCIEDGSQHKECTVCGEVVESDTIPATGHTPVRDLAVAPTCTTTGKTEGSHCSVCNAVIKVQETIVATGHTPSDWITDKKPTLSSTGKKHIECMDCGEILETASIPKLKKCSTPKLKSASRTSGGVKVTWGKASNADSYIVYRKTAKSGWSKIGTTTATSFIDTKAKTGTTYYYTVKAKNVAGTSGYNKTGLKIKFVAAPKLTKIANESSGVRVYWSKVSGADGYYLYRRVAGSKTWTKVATIKKGSTTSYLDKKASAGKTYEYIIKCYDGSTPSASAAKTIKVKRLTVPKLVSVKNGNSGVTVKWGKVAGASGYLVYRKTSSTSWVQIANITGNSSTSCIDSSVKNKTTYTYTIRAYSGSYKSAYNTKGLKITTPSAPKEDSVKKWFVAQFASAKEQYIYDLEMQIYEKESEIDCLKDQASVLYANYMKEVQQIKESCANSGLSGSGYEQNKLKDAEDRYKATAKQYTEQIDSLEEDITDLEAEITNPNVDCILAIVAEECDLSSEEVEQYYDMYSYYLD